MNTNDIISDSLARIRNAILRGKEEVITPSSKLVRQILDILKKEGFIVEYNDTESRGQAALNVTLKYVDGMSAIRDMRRVSKPGIRRYAGYRDLRKVKNGQGIAILSTSRGLMTAEQARAQRVGGEVVCEIW